jgi:hypothetical protein
MAAHFLAHFLPGSASDSKDWMMVEDKSRWTLPILIGIFAVYFAAALAAGLYNNANIAAIGIVAE